jgi:D-methionine transport system substrate-binding protein
MIPRRLLLAAALAGFAVQAQAADTLRIGTSAGPYTEILEFAGKIYTAKEGIAVKITEFPDYTMPNAALEQGDIDLNHFQHKPYLDNQIATRGYHLAAVERSIIVPMGIYAKSLKSLADLKDGAAVAIPNDPSNGARALILLQQAGVLKLDPAVGIKATVLDVTDNPKKLKIKEIDAAQLPRSLDDVAVAAVPLNYAVAAGMTPKTALFAESADTQWGLWFVAREDHKADPKVLKYIAAFRSPEVKAFIDQRFPGTIVTTW